ncbi:MAG: class I SAM-dependent methyltransferase [Planctomycetes bacterium]|nr:class I SAM-dependent methyltransferase [Planctomycetota bacterium]
MSQPATHASILPRVLEPESMDTAEEAADYDAMDHREVNARFVADLLTQQPAESEILDLGCGTAQIPIELCRQSTTARVVAIDLSAEMLALAKRNLAAAGCAQRVRIERVDAKELPYGDGRFATIMSNSIVHHIPEPRLLLADACRVLAPGGLLFIRDLMRPYDQAAIDQIVATYAAHDTERQRALFAASLASALPLEEIRSLVSELGFAPETVQPTSDRHWTWAARKPK